MALYRRGAKWLTTTAITWPVWALTGAPTGLPHATSTPHHLVVSAGIWPVYVMVGGLADIARRTRGLYVDPLIEANTAEED